MILKRVLMPLLLVGIIFGLSGVAQAQFSCSTTGVPVATVTKTGQAEPVGSLTVTCVPTGAAAATTATFVISYPGPIANKAAVGAVAAYPPGKGITLATTGNFTGPASITNVGSSITTGTNSSQILVTILPIASTTATSTFTISNVLDSVNSAAGASPDGGSLSATVAQTTVGTDYTVLTNTAVIATTFLSAIVPAGITVPVTGGLTSSGIVIGSGQFQVKIVENYATAFQSAAQFNGGFSTNSTQLNLVFTGIQPGMTLNNCQVFSSTSGSPSVSPGTLSAATNTLVVSFNSPVDQVNIDNVVVGCATITPGTSVTSFPPVTMQVTMGPVRAAGIIGAAGVTPNPNVDLIPGYASVLIPTAPLTVIGTSSLLTDMLIPYAILGAGFNTGISVSNTTSDPFGTANGGATPTSGSITFQGFGESVTAAGVRTPVTFTANMGAVAPGTTKSVLLSDVLSAGGVSTAGCGTAGGLNTCFTGYIFVIANFTNAHGATFVADVNFGAGSTKFSQPVPLLVMPPVTASNPRQPLTQTSVEGLLQ